MREKYTFGRVPRPAGDVARSPAGRGGSEIARLRAKEDQRLYFLDLPRFL
jgi:hypothetical protein